VLCCFRRGVCNQVLKSLSCLLVSLDVCSFKNLRSLSLPYVKMTTEFVATLKNVVKNNSILSVRTLEELHKHEYSRLFWQRTSITQEWHRKWRRLAWVTHACCVQDLGRLSSLRFLSAVYFPWHTACCSLHQPLRSKYLQKCIKTYMLLTNFMS